MNNMSGETDPTTLNSQPADSESKPDIRVDGMSTVLRAAFREQLTVLHDPEITSAHEKYIAVAIDCYLKAVRNSILAQASYGKHGQEYDRAGEVVVNELTSDNSIQLFASRLTSAIDIVVKKGSNGLLQWARERSWHTLVLSEINDLLAGVRSPIYDSQLLDRVMDFTMTELLHTARSTEQLETTGNADPE